MRPGGDQPEVWTARLISYIRSQRRIGQGSRGVESVGNITSVVSLAQLSSFSFIRVTLKVPRKK